MTFQTIIPKKILQHLKLRFFDVEAEIKSDSGNFMNLFARMFRRFKNDEPSSIDCLPVEFTVLSDSNNQWGKPVIIINSEVWPLSDPVLLEGYAYEQILIGIITRIQSHLLIHAGAVSSNGQGTILVADTGHGKTTLVLELVRRGFKFLSDEMAALGRADSRAHPFPRSLWIRKGTLELAGFQETAAGSTKWLDKLLLDIEEIMPDSLGEAVPVGNIVVLQDSAMAREGTQDNPRQELSVLVDRLDDSFLAAVNQIEGVTETRVGSDCGYPMLKLRSSRTTHALSGIEALCKKRQIMILDAIKGIRGNPAFKGPAGLEAMPKSQAVMELLSRFQGGYRSEILQDEFSGSSARLFMELSAIVSQANCYRLFVGPLREMADLVCRLVKT